MNIARIGKSALALLVLVCGGLYGQDFRATLTGQVTDQSGAAIPGAKVVVTRIDTNETKIAETNADGHYAVPYLNPGTYRVVATATGFKALQRDNVVLRVADKVALPLQLAVGEMSQSITVSSAQDVLDTADASRGLSFDPIKTQEYPLNGRQEYMLMALTPGVLFTQEKFGPGGYSGTRGWDTSNAYKINGARTGTNVFLLNGARISDNTGAWQVAPNIEAVQEFKVMTNTYDAQFGGFSGGAVNTTIKSGSNAFHGDVFDYFRNSYMDANNFANNFNGQPTPYHNQHQFGGTFGGPVRKDKDFFFVSFEGWREVLPAPSTSTVPTAAMKTGDFGSAGINIYDPLTSVPCNAASNCSGHQFVRLPFAGGIIPQNRISPVAQKILGLLPNPTNSLLTSNFNAPNMKDAYMYNQPIVRWDHNFGDRDKLYGMVTWQHGTENDDWTGFKDAASQGNINNARTDQNYIADYTHIISPTAVFDGRLSYGRFTNNQPGWGDPNFQATSLGMNGNCAPTVSTCAAPSIAFGQGYQRLFGNQWMPIVNWWSFNTYDLNPSVTLNKGKHTVHIGGEALYQVRPSQNAGWATGLLNFNQGWTQRYNDQNLGFTDGNSIASMMLGYAASGQVDNNPTQYISRPQYSGYVQDDWKVSPRLTINAGLRYEVQMGWLERYNMAIRGFDFNAVNPYSNAVLANWNNMSAQFNAAHPNDLTHYPGAPSALYGGLVFAGQNGQPSRLYNTDWSNFAPRLGLAYRLGDKTVVRAGGGVFYRQSQDYISSQYGFQQTTGFNGSLDGGQTPSAGANLTGPYSLANPFPQGIAAPAGNSLGMMTWAGNGLSFNNPNYRIPRTYQWSVAVERELPQGVTLEVAYTGNKEIFVPINYQMDASPADLSQWTQAQANGSAYFNHQLPNPFYGVLPRSQPIAQNPTISYGQLARNFPMFTGVQQNYIQVGRYRSDQLQVKAERRVMGGQKTGVLTFVMAYTFGKQMQADHRMDSWNTAEPLVYEIDDNAKVHEFAFSGVWDLPVGKGKALLNTQNKVLSQIFSNWRLDYILTYSSGYPVAWPALNNSCGTWQAADQTQWSWFNNNKSCYSTFKPYTLNPYQDRFSTIFNPSAPQLNAAVEKTIDLGERYKLLIRGEAFNLTNTVIRPGPDTNFNSPTFGMLPETQQNFPRTLQLAAKFTF